MFSWIAQNSGRSIIIAAFRTREHPCRTVYLWDHLGRRWEEPAYQGYGDFGGKNYHVLLAEMNRTYGDDVDEEVKRCDGIDMEGGASILHPNLTDSPEWTWRNVGPLSCEYQGGLIHIDEPGHVGM